MENLETILSSVKSDVLAKKDIYLKIAQRTHGVVADEASKIVEGELELFIHRVRKYLESPDNSTARITEVQAKNIFLEVMESGLSFSPVADHVYVSRLKGTGTAVGYKVTVDGLIHMAQKAGALDHLSEPVIVQNGEKFTVENTQDGFHRANHTVYFDGRPAFAFDKFLAGYVYLVYPNGNRELSWISASRMAQLRMKSSNQSMYNDESFIQTKIMKHALRKIRKSSFSNQAMLPDEDDDNDYVIPQAVQPSQAPTAAFPRDTRTNEQADQQLAQSMQQPSPQVQQFPPLPAQQPNDPFGGYNPVPQPQYQQPAPPQQQQWAPPPPPLPPVPPSGPPQFRDPFQ